MDYDNKEELFGMLYEFSECVTAVKSSINRYTGDDLTKDEDKALLEVRNQLKVAEDALNKLDQAIEV